MIGLTQIIKTPNTFFNVDCDNRVVYNAPNRAVIIAQTVIVIALSISIADLDDEANAVAPANPVAATANNDVPCATCCDNFNFNNDVWM